MSGLRFLGLGECLLRKIDVLEDQRISTEELEKQMQKDVDDGLKPFVIVGTLGEFENGMFDMKDVDDWFRPRAFSCNVRR